MAASEYHRVLFIFLDGIGLAAAGSSNPFSIFETPGIDRILGRPLTLEGVGLHGRALLLPVDATLGVEGLPQSATGQTALFTGENASQQLGHHATGLPGPMTRAIIERGNLFGWARDMGFSATFANAYTPSYLEAVQSRARRPSVTTTALMNAGLEPRGLDHLKRNRAVSWDIRRDHFAKQLEIVLPTVSAREAGRHLATLAGSHDLTVYESFLTDLAGHQRIGFDAHDAIVRVDGLLAGVAESVSAGTTVVMTSDHGNFEVLDDRRHTRNPLQSLAFGTRAEMFNGITSILEVTPRILSCLDGARSG